MWITWMWGLRDWAVEEIKAKATPESSKATWIWYIRNLTKAWIAWLLVLVWSQNLSTQQQAQAAVPSVSQPNSWPQTIDDLMKLYVPENQSPSWKIEISKLPDPIRADFQKMAEAFFKAKSLVEVTWWDFVFVRTWIKWPEELSKVIYNAENKVVTIWDFNQLTWVNLPDLFADMDKNLDWMQSAEQLRGTLTWQYLTSVYWKMKSWDKDLLTLAFDTFWRTWTNEIDKKILSPNVFDDFRTIFKSNVESLERRGLLSIETLYLATRTAISVSYQKNLLFREWKDWQVEYTWEWGKPIWVNRSENTWKDWRILEATERSVMGLLNNPDFKAWVYRVWIKYDWKESTIDFMFPLSPEYYTLVKQAVAHSVLWERWKLADITSIVASKQRVAASEQRVATSEQRVAIMDRYDSLTKWKQIWLELVPKLWELRDIRNQYAKTPWMDSRVLAIYDQTISQVELASLVADSSKKQ